MKKFIESIISDLVASSILNGAEVVVRFLQDNELKAILSSLTISEVLTLILLLGVFIVLCIIIVLCINLFRHKKKYTSMCESPSNITVYQNNYVIVVRE